MKLSKLYRFAVILIFVVFAISVSVEQADSRRRRRRVQCNTTGKVKIFILSDSKLGFRKTYTVRKSGYCGVRGGHCTYVGPRGKQAGLNLFNEWQNSHPADAKKLHYHLKYNHPGSGRGWATVSISCNCEGTSTPIISGQGFHGTEDTTKLEFWR